MFTGNPLHESLGEGYIDLVKKKLPKLAKLDGKVYVILVGQFVLKLIRNIVVSLIISTVF